MFLDVPSITSQGRGITWRLRRTILPISEFHLDAGMIHWYQWAVWDSVGHSSGAVCIRVHPELYTCVIMANWRTPRNQTKPILSPSHRVACHLTPNQSCRHHPHPTTGSKSARVPEPRHSHTLTANDHHLTHAKLRAGYSFRPLDKRRPMRRMKHSSHRCFSLLKTCSLVEDSKHFWVHTYEPGRVFCSMTAVRDGHVVPDPWFFQASDQPGSLDRFLGSPTECNASLIANRSLDTGVLSQGSLNAKV